MVDASFPSNSHTTKPASAPDADKPKIEKVIVGEVSQRKTPLGKRMAETFLGGDAKTVAHYVLFDVMLPAAKDMMSDAVSQGIDRMLFGDSRSGRTRGGSRPMSGAGGFVNYNRMGSGRGREREDPRQLAKPSRMTQQFDEVVFASRIEAETVLEHMHDLVNQYEVVTVSDFYDLVGMSSKFTDGKFGWDELPNARVVRDGGDYLLDLPRPKPVE